jgi:hypothetical protein
MIDRQLKISRICMLCHPERRRSSAGARDLPLHETLADLRFVSGRVFMRADQQQQTNAALAVAPLSLL